MANSLLRSPDYKTALLEVLQILGEAAQSDRCSLVQTYPIPLQEKQPLKSLLNGVAKVLELQFTVRPN